MLEVKTEVSTYSGILFIDENIRKIQINGIVKLSRNPVLSGKTKRNPDKSRYYTFPM
jgi:hypothetical protein